MPGKGGYEAPRGPRPPSGPGRFSQRDEQPLMDRDLDDPNMQYGDRKALRAAQQAAPLPNKPAPASRTAPSRASAPQRPAAGGGLPSFLFERPTDRPMEPEMTPASMPPPPVDEREELLQALYETYPSEDTLALINRFRSERTGDGGLGGAPQAGGTASPAAAGAGGAGEVPAEPVVAEADAALDLDSDSSLGAEDELEETF